MMVLEAPMTRAAASRIAAVLLVKATYYDLLLAVSKARG
jgi:hypothetical protein